MFSSVTRTTLPKALNDDLQEYVVNNQLLNKEQARDLAMKYSLTVDQVKRKLYYLKKLYKSTLPPEPVNQQVEYMDSDDDNESSGDDQFLLDSDAENYQCDEPFCSHVKLTNPTDTMLRDAVNSLLMNPNEVCLTFGITGDRIMIVYKDRQNVNAVKAQVMGRYKLPLKHC